MEPQKNRRELSEDAHNGSPKPMSAYLEPTVSFSDVMSTLARRKITFLTCLVVGLTTGLAAAFFIPPAYEAEAVVTLRKDPLIQMSQAERSGGVGALLSLGIGAGSNYGDATTRYLTILETRSFLSPFLQRTGLVDDLASDMEGDDDPYKRSLRAHRKFSDDHLEISRDRFDSMVRIRVSWSDAETAALIANSLIKELNSEIRSAYLREAEERLRYLTQLTEESLVTERRVMLFRLAEEEQRKILFANSNEEFPFEVLDPAFAPIETSSPGPIVLSVIGLVVGAVLGFLILMYLESRRHS